MTTPPPGVIVRQVVDAARAVGADDSALRLWRLWQEWASTTRVVVIGERSRGKSKLINAVVGGEVLPVDLDVTSNVYVELRGPRNADDRGDIAAVILDGVADPLPIRVDEIANYASEAGNPRNAKDVTAVLVRLNHPLLASGLSLVDTPGVGSLISGHGARAAEAIKDADGVIMVASASRELSDDELTFLDDLDRDTPVVIALGRKDEVNADETGRDPLQVIRAANREHLAARAPHLATAPMIAVSATMARDGQDLDDRELIDDSGVSDLLSAVQGHIVATRRWSSTVRLLEACRIVLGELAARDTIVVAPPAAAVIEAESAQLSAQHRALKKAKPGRELKRGRRDRLEQSKAVAVRELDELKRDYTQRINAKTWKRADAEALIDEFDADLEAKWSSWVRDLAGQIDRDASRVATKLAISTPLIDIDPSYPDDVIHTPMPAPRKRRPTFSGFVDLAMSLLSPYRFVAQMRKLLGRAEAKAHERQELLDAISARAGTMRSGGINRLSSRESRMVDAAIADIRSRQWEKLTLIGQRRSALEDSKDDGQREAARARLSTYRLLDRAIVAQLEGAATDLESDR